MIVTEASEVEQLNHLLSSPFANVGFFKKKKKKKAEPAPDPAAAAAAASSAALLQTGAQTGGTPWVTITAIGAGVIVIGVSVFLIFFKKKSKKR